MKLNEIRRWCAVFYAEDGQPLFVGCLRGLGEEGAQEAHFDIYKQRMIFVHSQPDAVAVALELTEEEHAALLG